MALTAEEQLLYDHAKQTLPKYMFEGRDGVLNDEMLHAFVKIFERERQQIVEWFQKTYVGSADGQWLDYHAKDRGTFRQNGESDEALRARLKVIEDTVTEPALLSIVSSILLASGVTASPAIVELRLDRANFRTVNGFKDSYLSRGYRMTNATTPAGIVIILPYGTSEGTANSVNEAIRNYKAGGFKHYIERRLNP